MALRERLSFANIVSVLALIVALTGGGVAYAAVTKNSVRSHHIVNGQVKAPDLGPDAVAGGKVRDRSLTGADVRDGTLGSGDLGPRTAGVLRAAATVSSAGALVSSFNRLGAPVSVVRTDLGRYTLTVPGATGHYSEKIVGVSTLNSLAECKQWTGDGETIDVICQRTETANVYMDAGFSIWLIQ